ncbi:endonuclease MutS2 [Virgibacillus sp. MSJ-26]|uniref:endonuclease MutS2 n=1 Tax=Virgibacillus sp. MSJ-26 TaxID=2841522 RepID=UPI001C102A93|nr:endonuclease MutS2 [Virgibacillus sp. MSJ-26]MBU5466563.1 endonuclease MutS2 [Virgibacillus sp. MSJ-26]
MQDRILRVLEYNKIKDRLVKQAETSLGKSLAFSIKPLTDLDAVINKHNETDEAATVVRLQENIPLGGIFDIRESINRSVIGGVLTMEECLNIASTIYGGRQTKNFIEKLDEELPILRSLANQISHLKELEREIKSCIDDRGQMLDSASEKLRGLRSAMRTFEGRVREKLDQIIRSKSSMLSDAIVTIRNNRYVLPVKQEHRGSIGGIVHDQSASGQTLFIEPKSVVDLNNQLQETVAKEELEIERILRVLSESIASKKEYLTENVLTLGEIDFIFSRAKLGAQMNGSMPRMNDEGFIKMQQARHPLIPRDEVVANDVELGKDFTTIVITGPNTGGKTVTLKMIGLCTLMAQSGLQVPAYDGCELAVFDHVFADIGDEQSIEQNLSTFSSHMTTIVNIIEEVNERSLVLFDELGAGTDPQEGAALAMSILDEVISRDARIIATTHYPELKAYGYNRDKVVNASVEFNVETLQPTYRLLIGVPGRSNAFDISKRLGLDGRIIEDAKELIGVDSKNVESMIASLEDSKLQSERDYEKAHQYLLESEKLRTDIQEKWHQFEQQKEQLYKKTEEKAERALQNAREEAELIVDEIRSMKTKTELKEHEWIEAKKLLEEAQPQLTEKDKQVADSQPSTSPKTFRPGDDVKVLSLNQVGNVLKRINNNEYLVQVGIMKVNVKQNDLQGVKSPKKAIEKPLATVKGSNYQVKTELDLRGERYEDALLRLEKYIDDALLAGYQKVYIIHGKGTGALRKGVQDFARKHRSISEYRFGSQGEGGSGVTVLELK